MKFVLVLTSPNVDASLTWLIGRPLRLGALRGVVGKYAGLEYDGERLYARRRMLKRAEQQNAARADDFESTNPVG